MSQTRISTFFSPSPTTAAYDAQLQRDRDEHSIAVQRAAIEHREQQARKRFREQQNIQQKRRPSTTTEERKTFV